ncbi:MULTISPECIES: hypothetical protein [unclassified Pseudofrankia]|uniref:hypothetical protein n=1 Tax=unclassified Pseudofrankia TaxID=2994372 RepID=UPI0008D9537E|nr:MULTISPECIES: hypothetical protein [unclassified Pseudofrankia]MDT3445720.1 hypothetical protein [Pseudofrankia sp. BMG5.37]OHV42473.1 hypothetical protein BCD48_31340 [Pseudofrankia sp. BMG5.36]
MRIRRIVLVSAITLGLAGTGAAAANAAGALPGSEGPSGQPSTCPAPPGGAGVDNVQVKDGKIYHNGKLVGTAKPGEPVAVKDGKVYVGADAEALPKPPGAQDLQMKDGKVYLNGKLVGEAKPGVPMVVKDGKVYTGADAEALPKPGDAKGPLLTRVGGGTGTGTGDKGFVCATEGAQTHQD